MQNSNYLAAVRAANISNHRRTIHAVVLAAPHAHCRPLHPPTNMMITLCMHFPRMHPLRVKGDVLLLNNAGIGYQVLSTNMTLAQWEEQHLTLLPTPDGACYTFAKPLPQLQPWPVSMGGMEGLAHSSTVLGKQCRYGPGVHAFGALAISNGWAAACKRIQAHAYASVHPRMLPPVVCALCMLPCSVCALAQGFCAKAIE